MNRLLISLCLFFICFNLTMHAQVLNQWKSTDVRIEDENGLPVNMPPDVEKQPFPFQIIEKSQFDIFANELGVHLVRRAVFDQPFFAGHNYVLVGNNGEKLDFGGSFNDFTFGDLKIVAVGKTLYIFMVDQDTGNLRVRSTDLVIDGRASNPVREPGPDWDEHTSTAFTTTNSRITDIVLDNELVHLVFEDGLEMNEFVSTSTRVGYARFNTTFGTWEETGRWISEGGGSLQYGYNPTIAVYNNRIFVVYLNNQGGPSVSISSVRFREFNNGWGNVIDLDKRTNSNSNQTQFPHVKAQVHNNELFVVSTYYNFDKDNSEYSNLIEFTKRSASGGTWSPYTTILADPGSNIEKNIRGLDLLSDAYGLHLVYSLRKSSNHYEVQYSIYNGINFQFNAVISPDDLGNGWSPTLASNVNGLHCVLDNRDSDRNSIGYLYYNHLYRAILADNGSNPSITKDTYFNGTVFLGGDNSNSTAYESITIDAGATVVTHKDASVRLQGNHLIVKGTLYYYSDNVIFGTNGQIINDGGTIIDLVPPAAPQNLVPTIVNTANNPRLDWDANTESDFAKYEIEKRKGSANWTVIKTITNISETSYIDLSESGVGFAQFSNNVEIKYRVRAFDTDENKSDYSNTVLFNQKGGGLEKRGDDGSSTQLPDKFVVSQNYPNPFNPTTTFTFALPETAPVRLTIFDLNGRTVAQLINEELPAGRYSLPFDASNLASGIYLYRLTGGAFTKTRRMMLIK